MLETSLPPQRIPARPNRLTPWQEAQGVKPGKSRVWSSGAEAVRDFKFRHGMKANKMSILSAIWEKEMGSWVNHWSLVGLKRGVLYISPKSSAAAQELQMRSGSVIAGLNKYFSSAWIKTIRANSTWPLQEEKTPSAA